MEGVVIMKVEFYKGKSVLITGHTGFKGTWLTKILLDAGATVVGYSLEPPTHPSLSSILDYDNDKTNKKLISARPTG